MSRRVVVVGGGLAGLLSAVWLAREGLGVTVLEGSSVGGRARTQHRDGYALNLGPHALYRGGAARRALDELGIAVGGHTPASAGWTLDPGPSHRLPLDPVSLVRTGLLSLGERLELGRFFARLPFLDGSGWAGRSVDEWLSGASPAVGAVLKAVVRVTTYCAATDVLDAGATVAQLQLALANVDYLDGGWQSLVDPLLQLARGLGVEVVEHRSARSVRGARVSTDDGDLDADAVLLCVAPDVAARLTGSEALAEVAATALPVRAACLDVALEGPLPRIRGFGLGLRRPLYASVHSATADLAPPGGCLVHGAVYGGVGESDVLRTELESALDQLLGDWRPRVRFVRWMPRLVVSHDLPRAARGGHRASAAVPDRPGVWCAGDWVGDEGMLLDAAVASARVAVRGILASVRGEAA